MAIITQASAESPASQEVVAAPVAPAQPGHVPTETTEAQQALNAQPQHGAQAHPPQNVVLNHLIVGHAGNAGDEPLRGSLFGRLGH